MWTQYKRVEFYYSVNSENFILKFSVVGGNIAKKSLWEYFLRQLVVKLKKSFYQRRAATRSVL